MEKEIKWEVEVEVEVFGEGARTFFYTVWASNELQAEDRALEIYINSEDYCGEYDMLVARKFEERYAVIESN